MGSCYFYLEFLIAWLDHLKTYGDFSNPAIFALEYTLVGDPSGTYPTQVKQAILGYEHVLSVIGDSARVCIAGDSAGGTLALSLLLHLSSKVNSKQGIENHTPPSSVTPGMVTLISPWVTLVSTKDRNTRSDYLDVDTLHRYAREYAGRQSFINDPRVSPGNCKDINWWRKASPLLGYSIHFGSEEVFAPEIRDFAGLLQKAGVKVTINEDGGGIHAWPVASLFLSNTRMDRQKGLLEIVHGIKMRMGK